MSRVTEYRPAAGAASAETMAEQSAARVRTILVAGTVGNVMEWYDFGIYGTFSPVIATQFFPSADPLASLLASFAVFASGFFARPLGALAFGHIGDRLGRKPALLASVILMAVPTFLIGLLPTYAQIGVLAPLLLVLLRLLQGLSAGGELSGSTSFLLEHGPAGRRGLYAAWAQVGATVGVLLGTGIGALLAALLPPEAYTAWGWRIAFGLGLGIGLGGLFLRRHLAETPAFTSLEASGTVAASPVAEAVQHARGAMLTVAGLVCMPTVATYFIVGYMPSHLEKVVGLTATAALTLDSVAVVALAALLPLMGALGDRVGRRPLLVGSAGALLLLGYPLWVLLSSGTVAALVGLLLFAVAVAVADGGVSAAMPEAVPTRVRYTAFSVGYNAGIALFGGTTPFIATALVAATHDAAAPSLYLMATAVITLATALRMKDRYREPLQ